MTNIIEEMFFDFQGSKEMGDHRFLVHSKQEAVDWVRRNNGFVNCYISIYKFNQFNSLNGRPIYESAEVSHIYVDIDNDDGLANEHMKRLHEHLIKQNIRHWIMFSGGGYHFYIFCNPISNLLVDYSVGETIANFQNSLEDITSIKICSSCKGNLSKVSRIVNTYHIKQKRFAIPVNDPYSDHISLSSQPIWNIKIFGSKLIDLSIYKSKKVSDPLDIPMIDINGVEFPPCILKIVKNPNPGYEERMALVAFLNEIFRLGAEQISTDDIIRITDQIVDFLESLKWKKFSRSKSKKYIRWLVKGLSKSFSHQKIRNLGICGHCEAQNNAP